MKRPFSIYNLIYSDRAERRQDYIAEIKTNKGSNLWQWKHCHFCKRKKQTMKVRKLHDRNSRTV